MEGSDKAVLGGLIVVGGDHQHGVSADFAGIFGQFNGIGSVVAAGACNDGHTTGGALNGIADAFFMLCIGKGGAFAGGTADDQSIDAAFDLPVDQTAHGLIVHLAVAERGDQGSGNAFEDGFSHDIYLHRKIGRWTQKGAPSWKAAPDDAKFAENRHSNTIWNDSPPHFDATVRQLLVCRPSTGTLQPTLPSAPYAFFSPNSLQTFDG